MGLSSRKGYTLEDLDLEQLQNTLAEGVRLKRIPPSSLTNIPDTLEKLELSQNGQLNHSALVLFGRRTGLHYPQCMVRMARFRGVDKNEFIDHRQAYGHAFHLLEQSEQFLARHIPIRGRIPPDQMKRIDEPAVPFEAMREALINALCHRDYLYRWGN